MPKTAKPKRTPPNRSTDDAVLVRMTSVDKERLRVAAEAERRPLANYILNAALDRADRLLRKGQG